MSESGAPLSIVALDAVSVTVGAAFVFTVMVTVAVLVCPPDAVAVMVYVVVWVGETEAEPDVAKVPEPTDGLMLTLAALLLVQVRVALWPDVMVEAEAVSETVGPCPGGGCGLRPSPAPQLVSPVIKAPIRQKTMMEKTVLRIKTNFPPASVTALFRSQQLSPSCC